MAFFKKQNKDAEGPPVEKVKSKKDKSIKPRAPKMMAGRKVGRFFFWVFMSLLFLKGALAFAQGNRTINQTIVKGNTTPIVSDSVKGFALDFATEYFTWDANFVADRTTRLSNFIKGIDPDMGLKNFDVKGSSKVTSAEVYGTNQIDAQHIDVTVVIRRDVQQLPDQLLDAQDKATTPPLLKKKAYMIVSVTLAKEGPVIQSYPRFVSEQQRGDTIDSADESKLVGNADLQSKAKELADSYIRSWYEGNAGQLRYFYADTEQAPRAIQKSDFVYQKLEQAALYQMPSGVGESSSYRIVATVTVNSDLGEPFTNTWNLDVVEQDARFYVTSNGIQSGNNTAQSPSSSPAPSATSDNNTAPITNQ
ncbi:conjugal transfer protein [Cohnella soli]|uniref:Conjugal transfer protein n=1 Tax=Cohnella soli TaxID=425005 RepID=A0ABW0HMK6_9BACL